jgi:hypothetical protein
MACNHGKHVLLVMPDLMRARVNQHLQCSYLQPSPSGVRPFFVAIFKPGNVKFGPSNPELILV